MPPRPNEMSKEDFRDGYVDAWYPNLCGYAYQAEIISEREGQQVMEDLLARVEWIEDPEKGQPVLHMKDGRELFVQDTDDFPTPTDQCDQ